jgi:NAD(P)H-dependent FMN reductase
MRLAVMGGSLRKASLNARFLRHLAHTLEVRGHSVSVFAGEALRLPLYDADLPEAPPGAKALQSSLLEAGALVIVSPEYNAGIPGHLKNAVDWASTMEPSPWTGLPVLLCSASPGAFGGARGMLSWRATLANMGAFTYPGSVNVPHADKNLDAAGAPTDSRTLASLGQTLDGFLDFAAKLRA